MFWKFGGRRFEEDLRSILAKGRPEWDLSYGDSTACSLGMGPELHTR
jgi:hypothetical protein